MKLLLKVVCNYVILFTLLSGCAQKNALIENDNLKITYASREKSVLLKKSCLPLKLSLGLTDQQTMTEAISLNADTVQIFRSYRKGVFITTPVRDIRFWNCNSEGSDIKPMELKLKEGKKDELVRVLVVNLINKTDKDSANYEWLSESLSDAIVAAMGRKFTYLQADRKSLQNIYANSVKSPEKTEELKKFCEKENLHILVFGYYSFNLQTNEIEMHVEIYSKIQKKIIGIIRSQSPINDTIFGKTREMTDAVVHKIQKVFL